MAAAMVALLTLTVLLIKLKPVKWLWNQVVVEPLGQWFDARVGQVVDAKLDARPLTNGKGWRTVQAIADATGADIPEPPEGEH